MRFDIYISHNNAMVQLLNKHQSIFKPKFKGQFVRKEGKQKQKTNISSAYKYNIGNLRNDFDNYQLFQQRKLICEALDCNKVATDSLNISIGIYGEQDFFFCRNCVNKFGV